MLNSQNRHYLRKLACANGFPLFIKCPHCFMISTSTNLNMLLELSFCAPSKLLVVVGCRFGGFSFAFWVYFAFVDIYGGKPQSNEL